MLCSVAVDRSFCEAGDAPYSVVEAFCRQHLPELGTLFRKGDLTLSDE